MHPSNSPEGSEQKFLLFSALIKICDSLLHALKEKIGSSFAPIFSISQSLNSGLGSSLISVFCLHTLFLSFITWLFFKRVIIFKLTLLCEKIEKLAINNKYIKNQNDYIDSLESQMKEI